jgi:hypothetical protein
MRRRFGWLAVLLVGLSLVYFSTLNWAGNSGEGLQASIETTPSDPSGPAPREVLFTAVVTGATGGSCTYEWGDAVSGDKAFLTHTFEDPGDYTVTLDVDCGEEHASSVVQVKATSSSCQASDVVTTTEVSYGIELAKNKIQTLINAAPMISSASVGANGNFSKETSEKCCQPDDPAPVEVNNYSGTATLEGEVTFNIPGWSWKIEEVEPIDGLFKVKGEISFGPELTLSPSGSLEISGTDDPCVSSHNVEVTGSIDMDVELSCGVHGELNYAVWQQADGVWLWEGTVAAVAEVIAEGGVGASVTYPLPDGPGTGSFHADPLMGRQEVSFTLGSWNPHIIDPNEKELWPGFTS